MGDLHPRYGPRRLVSIHESVTLHPPRRSSAVIRPPLAGVVDGGRSRRPPLVPGLGIRFGIIVRDSAHPRVDTPGESASAVSSGNLASRPPEQLSADVPGMIPCADRSNSRTCRERRRSGDVGEPRPVTVAFRWHRSEQVQCCDAGHGPTEKIPLGEFATRGREGGDLRLALDALSHTSQTQRIAHPDDGRAAEPSGRQLSIPSTKKRSIFDSSTGSGCM